MFQHQKDQIKIGSLVFPLSFFQEQEPAYVLPEGAIGREYTPNVEHVIHYPGWMVGADLDWAEGNVYLMKVEAYRTAWEAKQQANEPTPTEPKKYPKWADLEALLNESDLFAKAYSVANQAAGAWSLLLKSLDSMLPPDSPTRLQNFAFAIAEIRAALGDNDFTAEQVDRFNQMLADCDFELTIA
jgi:hypothetical protein